MKEKLFNSMQKFSRAMFIPVLILPIAGLLIAIGNLFTNPGLLELFPIMDNSITTGFGTILSSSLVSILSNLGLIFAVGIAVGLADKKRAEAGFTTVLAYLVFIYAMNAFMTLNGTLADPESLRGTGQAMVLGVQILDMGVFLGIILGIIAALVHNRYADKEFDNALQIYGGSRFVFIVLIPIVVLLAIGFSYVWPIVQGGINSLGGFITNSGNFGLMLYGMLERLLIPTGLHHLVYTPFLYTSLGGVAEVGGVVFEGSRNIYFAEMADSTVSMLSQSVIWDARGISKMFGLIGASLAMYHTAKPENKTRAKSLLIPAAFTSFIAGVTEPIEFSFMFVAPILFVIHSVLSGLSMVVLNLLNVRAIGPNGFIDFLLYNVPLGFEKTRWPYYILVGLLFFVLYYVIFRFAITKFNLKTLGREDNPEDTRLYSKKDFEEKGKNQGQAPGEMKDETVDGELSQAATIVAALGGADNISTLTNCYSRLRLTVEEPAKVDEARLKNETGATGVMINDKNVHVVYGLQVNKVRRSVDEYLGRTPED